jgi:hypothetical protein
MEPKKKFELKPETLPTTAPRGTKILLPKQSFKLTGEIVQRKIQICKQKHQKENN